MGAEGNLLTPRLGKGFTNVSPGASRREPQRLEEMIFWGSIFDAV